MNKVLVLFLAMTLPLSALALPADINCMNKTNTTTLGEIQIRAVPVDGINFWKMKFKLDQKEINQWAYGPTTVVETANRQFLADGFSLDIAPTGTAALRVFKNTYPGISAESHETYICSPAKKKN
ncbi:MAG: hypothetical protein V4736_03800 [Bdellovibrionota bacterium]